MRRLLALSLCFLWLAGCTRVATATPSGRHPWTHPGVLRIADTADPDHFNPLLSGMDLVEDLSSLVFSYLIIADGNGKLVGDLATQVPSLANGGISSDGKTYVYHLRRGVRWHDGAPFTAHDVAFTWRAIVAPQNNVLHREGYTEVARIDVPDDRTVVVHLKRRYPPFVSLFFTTLQEGSKAVLPEHLLGALGEINDAPFNQHPVGTGPFKFVKWERGRGMEFVANPDYFKGRPKLDKIEFAVIPDDDSILAALQTHAIDMVVSVSTSQYRRYAALDGVATRLFPWNAANVFILNNTRPGLRELAVRQAVAQAIDYRTIIDKVTHGVGLVAHDIVPPGATGYAENPPYRYDPAAANALLERAGWRRAPDGIRSKGATRLAFTMVLSTGSANARNIAIQVQAFLRSVGIEMNLKTYPYNVIFSYDGPIQKMTYDFANYSYTLPYDPDNIAYLGCDQRPPKGQNVFGYCDPQVDIGERAGLETDDPSSRGAIYRAVSARIHATVPYIPLYVLRRPTAYNSDLKNYTASPAIASWWNAYQWQI